MVPYPYEAPTSAILSEPGLEYERRSLGWIGKVIDHSTEKAHTNTDARAMVRRELQIQHAKEYHPVLSVAPGVKFPSKALNTYVLLQGLPNSI